ncbi:hypothetical protein E2320_005304 [Naja naja]|nr:hypothetical protein E2320_005304 [Naja naja]
MEKVLCSAHGFPCFLKTGNRDGPNKGKSFYMCGVQNQEPCGFVLTTDLSPSYCLVHEDYIVELQVLIRQTKTDLYRIQVPVNCQLIHSLSFVCNCCMIIQMKETHSKFPVGITSNFLTNKLMKMEIEIQEKKNQKRDVQTSDGEQPPIYRLCLSRKEFSSAMHIKVLKANMNFNEKSNWKTEGKTQIQEFVTLQELKKLFSRTCWNSIAKTPILLFQTGKNSEEQKCTEKHLDSDKQKHLCHSMGRQLIPSKERIALKNPSILSEGFFADG